MGQNAFNIGCGKQFGGRALPCSDTIDIVSHFPNISGNCFCDNLFGAFFLVQNPNAVFFVQTQCFVVHIAPGHQNAGGLAHTLALHDPAGVRCPHQAIGTRNLLERIVCGLFAQMVDQQNADIVLISQCLQCADLLVIAGIHTVVLVAGTYLLQGVDDDEANIRVSMDETDDLFFQSLPNSVAFRLQNEPFRVFFCIDKLVKTLLQTTQCIFQREIKHGSRFCFTPPHRFPLRNLQAEPQRQPTFACFAGACEDCQPCREQTGDNPFYRRNRRCKQCAGGNGFR
mgnify:CR=1 FL=1